MLDHLKAHLKGKVVILGIGNSLRSDDAVGSVLAVRLQGKVPYIVYDAAANPENYLGKIIKDKPDNIVIIDAADFGAKPGEFNVIEGRQIQTVNIFSTHDASISLTTNYLQSNLKVDIIMLVIQPKTTVFGEGLSREVASTLDKLEGWFSDTAQKKG